MNRIFTVLATAILLAGCGQDNNTSQSAQTTTPPASPEPTDRQVEKHSGILLQNMNTAVGPGDNFNAYVNGSWIDSAEIPADRASDGTFVMLRDEAQENVKLIIEASAEGDFAKGTDEQKVGDLYTSYMDMDTRNALGTKPLDSGMAKIEVLENYQDLAVYFADANKLSINMPFGLGQYVDFKNPNSYMMLTWQGGLGLPDRQYYFDDGEKPEAIRQAYVKYIHTMFDLAGLPEAADAANMIMALETRIAAEQMLKEDTRDMVALYNKIPLAELSELMPKYSWDAYLDAAGISNIDGLVVTQLDYMKALDDIITSTSMQDWKTYLRWKLLNTTAEYLSADLDNQKFDFYSKTLNGVEQQLPMWKRAVTNVNNNLGEVVGKVYVARHFPPEAKARMLELVNNLLKAYEISITDLDWMSDATKVEALRKLSKFTPKIGYPDKWKDYSSLNIEADDLLGNMARSSLFVYETNIARQGGPVDRSEWGMTPQTINAYYNPPLNEIVFPAAILQPPFFDLYADDAVNYGAIGAVIGHEIGHGFDDSGSTFDGDGVLRNWWTDADKVKFEKLTARLVGQYSAFQPFDDLHANGEFTLGENIGDLGGLSIGLLAYKLSLNGAEPPVLDGFTGMQRVFIGWAQVWRSKMRDEALRSLINTNPHSPPQYRINGVVPNVPEFYEAFDVLDSDALYLAPEDRVKIW